MESAIDHPRQNEALKLHVITKYLINTVSQQSLLTLQKITLREINLYDLNGHENSCAILACTTKSNRKSFVQTS